MDDVKLFKVEAEVAVRCVQAKSGAARTPCFKVILAQACPVLAVAVFSTFSAQNKNLLMVKDV